ncbi:DUF2914 domain-containing protein [Hahella ganghwensis]|uniref:DUF2914 domain-containing protein n=1 Tax=Hahella ganghwensis TaxID=286420 RepID=UPI000362DEA7|nr:DUF2914 domain-containing protein [Hahella ganghwensis]
MSDKLVIKVNNTDKTSSAEPKAGYVTVYHWDRIFLAVIIVIVVASLSVWALSRAVSAKGSAAEALARSKTETSKEVVTVVSADNTLETVSGTGNKTESGSANNTENRVASVNIDPSVNEEPSADGKTSAINERSAERKPLADREPLASNELLANSANIEPSAEEEPSVEEKPLAEKEPAAGHLASEDLPVLINKKPALVTQSVTKEVGKTSTEKVNLVSGNVAETNKETTIPESEETVRNRPDSAQVSAVELKNIAGEAPEVSVYTDQLRRVVLTTELRNFEPINEIQGAVQSREDRAVKVILFTEIEGMTGKEVFHNWYLGDRRLARIRIKPHRSPMRASSSKHIDQHMTGSWTVKVTDNSDQVLAVARFEVK